MRALLLAASAGIAVALHPGWAEAQDKAAPARPAEAKAADSVKDVRSNQYCTNIADAAADARYAWQKETLTSLEKEIEGRIRILEQKRAEYEEWLRRRNEFLAKADASLVEIYSRMRPDAAALQLANMNDEKAAAILAKLNPRNASAVLNEMEPARAAQLTGVIADKPKHLQDREKS